MSDTTVKLVAQIDATSKGLVEALNKATGAVNSTAMQWQNRFDRINKATDSISEHVQRLNEIIARAGDGALDTEAIQAELNALNQAQIELEKTSADMDTLASSAQKAGKSIKESAQTTANATSAFGAMTDKIKLGGIALKDLKDAFSNSATSAVAWGNLIAAAISTSINRIGAIFDAVDELEARMKRIDALGKNIKAISTNAQTEDTGKLASKMKELYDLRENWSGSESEKAKEKLLQDEIALLQNFQKESDRIAVSINGQTVAQERLRMAIVKTLELEKQMKISVLQTDIKFDTDELKKAETKFKDLTALPDDFKSILKRQLDMLFSGDIGGFVKSGWISPKTLKGFTLREDETKALEAYLILLEKVKKEHRELIKLNHDESADNFLFSSIAEAKDKKAAKAQAEEEAHFSKVEAEALVKQAISRLKMSQKDRELEDAKDKIAEEFAQNLNAGVSKKTATELATLQYDEVQKKIAEEEQRKSQELIDAMDKKVQAYQTAYQKYLDAEAEVERAQKAYADAQKDLARETQRDAINKRRNAIRERLNTFGFRVADNFSLSESAHDRHARQKQQKTDASISEKMAQWETGKKVHFSVAERERLAEYEGLKNEDRALEATQKQMDAARQTENAAERLTSAAEAVKRAADRLEESKGELKKSKSGIDEDKIEEAEAIVKAKSRNTRVEPARHYAFSPAYEPESSNGESLKIYGVSSRLEHGKGLQGLRAKGLNSTNARGISYSDQLSQIHADLKQMMEKTYRVK